MLKQLPVEIRSVEQLLFKGVVNYLVALGVQGELAIYPQHMPLLTALKPGPIRLMQDSRQEIFYVSGGLLAVQTTGVIVFADTALHAAQLDEAAARQAKLRAEQLLNDHQAVQDHAAVMAELSQALAQLRLIQQLKKRGMK
jgi:F-type H+-transporting ATPase subunit epsilon